MTRNYDGASAIALTYLFEHRKRTSLRGRTTLTARRGVREVAPRAPELLAPIRQRIRRKQPLSQVCDFLDDESSQPRERLDSLPGTQVRTRIDRDGTFGRKRLGQPLSRSEAIRRQGTIILAIASRSRQHRLRMSDEYHYKSVSNHRTSSTEA